MAPFIFFLIIIIISSFSFALSLAINECHGPTASKPPAMFIFGDSYFDPGNNNYIKTITLDQANFWPYGETYFNFPTGRFSDGRLLSDFIAEFAKKPLIPAYMKPGIEGRYSEGVNFASGGAGALVETFQGSVVDEAHYRLLSLEGFTSRVRCLCLYGTLDAAFFKPNGPIRVISLKTQLMNYKKVEASLRKDLKDAKTNDILSRAVYLFSIGTNDYTTPFVTNSTLLTTFGPSHYVQMVIGNLTTVIKEIYNNGGRKFGFINVGPLGCSPTLRRLNPRRNGSCYRQPSAIAKLHNDALSELLKIMGKHFPGFKYALYDFYTNVKWRTNHPSIYGLKEGKRACCGIGRYRGILSCGGKRPVKKFELCPNPNDYLYWDSIHLTERAYKQMAHQMWNELGIGPFNLWTFFHCL